MKTKIVTSLLILISGILLTGCSLIGTPAGLKIETDQLANVFIDGKIVGKTPYENTNIKGKKEVVVKIIPEIIEKPLVSWESTVPLLGGTWTAISRELAVTESDSSGHVLSMQKNKDKNSTSIQITTQPDGAVVTVNQDDKGVSPITLDNLLPADYTIQIKKDGYVTRHMRLKTVMGYSLVVEVTLGQVPLGDNITPSLSATTSGQPTLKPSVTVTNKPIPTTTKQATVTTSPTKAVGNEMPRPYITIKDTEVGFLRVREKPSTGSTELTQVKPGEKYSLLDEENGWYKITYQTGKEGWVAGQYVTKYE